MKNNAFDFSAFAVALIIIAIIFSACSNSNTNVDPNESGADKEFIADALGASDTDNGKNVTFHYLDCFIADDPYVDPSYVEATESYDCIPGYIYYEKEVFGEVRLLFDKKLRIRDFNDAKDTLYVITQDNELVKINKADRSYKTVYKSQYGDITAFSGFDYDKTFMFLNDGGNIVRFDRKTEESKVIAKIDKELDYQGLIAGRDIFPREGFYYCDKCGGGDECFLWEDEDYNWYWYHPETGKSQKLNDLDDIWWGEPGVDYPDYD